MRLEGIRRGDIVEVNRLGRRFYALVSGSDDDGLEILPLDRRVTYRSCRAQQVIAHWSRRGRGRAAAPDTAASEERPTAGGPASSAPQQLPLDGVPPSPQVSCGRRVSRV